MTRNRLLAPWEWGPASISWNATVNYVISLKIAYGWSSMTGIVSALLAKSGVAGLDTVWNGEKGYDRAIADKYNPEKIIVYRTGYYDRGMSRFRRQNRILTRYSCKLLPQFL